jgi:hypothetical protein
MKGPVIVIPARNHYSIYVIHPQTEGSSVRLGRRQLTISDHNGQCQALLAALIFTLSQADSLRNPNCFPDNTS